MAIYKKAVRLSKKMLNLSNLRGFYLKYCISVSVNNVVEYHKIHPYSKIKKNVLDINTIF